ncbi:hypothetical protein [Arthrobacter alpinus]|uniref:hypothetical protein n=1 Tax=Arthrobacter alpinus TaxID=656366 RepID=UPI0016464B4F|nr:hypothetical protein [Arthrobacter alpinus]
MCNMSQGKKSPEAHLRSQVSATKTYYRKFLAKSLERGTYYQEQIARLEAEHAALLAEGAEKPLPTR